MASVDVVIPNYQYGRYLRSCVESVLSQGIADVRVIIIDNASTDDSVAVARQLAAEDRRIEVIARSVNLGQHASFNEGIDRARADYFLILCSDDMLAPGALARALSIMEENPSVVLSYGVADRFRNTDAAAKADSVAATWTVFSGRGLIERMCTTAVCHIAGCTAVVRTSAQKAAGHYRSHLADSDDVEMWLRVALLGDVAETGAIQGIMRIHDLSRSAAKQKEHDRDVQCCADAFDSFFAREGGSLPDAARLRATTNRGLSARAYWSGVAHLLRRQPRTGARLLRTACARRPLSLVLPPVAYLMRRPDLNARATSIIAAALGRPMAP